LAWGRITWATNIPRTALEELQVSGELLDAVDAALALDLHCHRPPLGITAQQVHRTDLGSVLPAHEHHPRLELITGVGQERLEVGLHAVLLETRVDTELVDGVGEHLLDRDDELLAGGVRHRPSVVADHQAVRSVHPVQGLVRPAVGVDGHAPVLLHHDEPSGHREMGGQATLVVHRAPGDDEPHRRLLTCVSSGGVRG